jgi:hypothetical protein
METKSLLEKLEERTGLCEGKLVSVQQEGLRRDDDDDDGDELMAFWSIFNIYVG